MTDLLFTIASAGDLYISPQKGGIFIAQKYLNIECISMQSPAELCEGLHDIQGERFDHFSINK